MDYQPIDCDLHDLIESAAVTRCPVTITWLHEDRRPYTSTAVVTDVFARLGAEFLQLADGRCIRLDRLIEIDGRTFKRAG